MRLLEAHIDGFGQLNNRHVRLDAPVIVVFGPNEAGKSTLFGYLRTMLYGFAKRNQPAERMEPTGGGRHGGRLMFRDSAGAEYILERYAESAGGKPKVRRLDEADGAGGTHASEELMEQTLWERSYLGGIGERLYRQLYAVSLTELREVGALSGEELGRYLYQAGWEEGQAIAAAEKKITAELEALFKPRGSNQRLIAEAKAVERLDAELRRLDDGIERFNALRHESELAEEAIAKLEALMPETEARYRLLRKAVASRPLWLRRMQLLAERESLLYAETLPAGAQKSWDELGRAYGEAEALLQRLRRERSGMERERDMLHYDDALIALADETDAQLQSAERMRSLKLQRAEWQMELRSLDESIGEAVSSISPDWTERQLRALSVTVADRDYARDYRERLSALQRQAERLSGELETLRGQERERQSLAEAADEKRRRAQAKLESGAPSAYRLLVLPAAELTEAWNSVDEALRAWELAQARSGSSREAGAAGDRGTAGGAAARWLLPLCGIGIALALAAASASGLAGDAAGAGMLLAAGIGGASAAALIALRWLGGSSRRAAGARPAPSGGRAGRSLAHSEAAAVQEALAGLLEEPEATAAALLGRQPGTVLGRQSETVLGRQPAALDSPRLATRRSPAPQGRTEAAGAPQVSAAGLRSALRTLVQERAETLAECARLEQAQREEAARLAALRGTVSERAEALAAVRRSMQTAAEQWGSWLTDRALPSVMSPAAALEAFDLADGALQQLRQYDRLAERVGAADKELAAYAEAAARLCAGFGDALRQASADPALALRLLQAEIRRQAAVRGEAAELERQLRETSLALEAAEAKLAELKQAKAALVAGAGLDDEAGFETALEHLDKLKELNEELLKLDIELKAGLTDARLADLEELLAGHDEEQLQQALDKARLATEETADKLRGLLEQRGGLKGAMDRLLGEDKRRELLAEREMALSGLSADMERYATLAIAKALIESTRRVYEEQRQPLVLRNASRYMSILTEGRYRRVAASPDQRAIRLERADRVLLDSGLLSRGTAEQLYLAMRLALAKEASRQAALPLLLDDLFVNFDKSRLQAAASLMSELSEERQILLFTCHEHIRDALLAHCGQARLVDWSASPATLLRNEG